MQQIAGAGARKMSDRFVDVADAKALDELMTRSQNEPVVLFKHSTTCPISARAHREMERFAGADVNIVIVQRARELSREIERRTGVRHESPQALVIRGGEVVWNASHYDVTEEAVKQAMEANR
jgi:bacillithiol system protein YtxJ